MPQDVGGGFILGALFAWLAGGWSGALDWPHCRLWVPFALLAGLSLAFLEIDPPTCGLLVGRSSQGRTSRHRGIRKAGR